METSEKDNQLQIVAEASDNSSNQKKMTIVGIGASAGGLEALRQFFTALSADSGMGFVVIMHLAPDQKSLLPELLQRHTSMPVHQVSAKTKVEPNHVYVIPPGQRIVMTNTHVDVQPFSEPQGSRTPIDDFFRSLATTHREAIAVILSGSGTDGAVGIKAVKEKDGLLLVQQPEEAEFDGMPRAAIVTGLADLILPVAELAQRLLLYQHNGHLNRRHHAQLSAHEQSLLHRILTQVHIQTGHDFSSYQHATLLRRVYRRLHLHNFQTLDGYLEFMGHNLEEAHTLFNDLLVGVTTFFRSPDTWQALAEQVIPHLFAGKKQGGTVRVWSIGCATGEEAYSLAILLLEAAEQAEQVDEQVANKSAIPIKIFASDLDEGALARARTGLYPEVIEADISPERLARFFVKEGNFYRIRADLREAVIFANHSVLYDPPFSHVDLISSRNLLTHLQRPLRRTVLEIFYYALNPGGYLFLDNLDALEINSDLFQALDKTHHIYAAQSQPDEIVTAPMMPFSFQRARPSPREVKRPPQRRLISSHAAAVAELNLAHQHERTLEALGPPSVLVDENYQILHLSETVGRFLLPQRGPISHDLLQLVRPELQPELQKALFLAFQQQKPVFTMPVPVPFNGASHRILISIHPYLSEPASASPEPLALLFFLEEGAQPEPEATSEIAPAESVQEAQWLGELQYLHARLRELSKQHLATHEELHLANEELKALNDENRSAIEELETSKEQLHSLNEELRTTNHHLQQRLTEISQAHSDIENLMTATDIPVLFLDNRLHIQRYTPAAKQLFPLQSTDLGRHISHLAHHLRYDDLVSDAQQVFNSLVPLAREVEDENGRWLLARHHPYRNFDNERIEGVVLSFVDISDLKWAETALRQSEARLAREVAALRRLHQMTVRVVTTSDRQQALDEILNAAVEILQADFGNIQLLDQSRRTLSIAAQSGFEDAFLKRFQEVSAEDDTACGRALRQGQRVIISDVAVDAAYAPYLEMAQAAGYQATQSTPLINYRGEVLGMLSTHYRQPMSLTERDEQMLDLLAYQAANLIERLRAEDRLEYRVQQRTRQVRRLASELIAAEQTVRQRVAQTLHDDLQQTLFGAKVQLQFLQEEVGESETLTDLAELVSQCLKLTRHLTVELSPPILEEEGLPEALAWLGAHMRELYGLQVSFDVRDRPEMVSEEVRILLYQIVRELLFNVVKHAGVLEAEILLEQEADGLLLTVRDQGQGFDVATLVAETNASFGLRSIQERLQLFDGWAAVESEPRAGTRVQLFLPQVAPEKE